MTFTFWYQLRYYMVVLQVEKMYQYISECEKRLTDATPLFPINREGAYYLKSYPWLKNIADYIFVLGFPLGYIVLCVTKIVNEWDWTTPLKYVDIIVLCLIIFFLCCIFQIGSYTKSIGIKKYITSHFFKD